MTIIEQTASEPRTAANPPGTAPAGASLRQESSSQECSEPGVSAAKSTSVEPAHHRGLLLIGIFKLAKSIFFFAVGLGAIHLLHKDLGDVAMRIAVALGRDPEGRLVTLMMEKVDLIDAERLRQIGFGTFAYSVVALIEGYGLTRERVWAEYLTLSLTVAFLPWEAYELARHPTGLRLSLLVINLLVLVYLLVLLRLKRRSAAAHT